MVMLMALQGHMKQWVMTLIGWWLSKCSNNDHQCKRSVWGILKNHSICGWHEVFNYSHKSDANMNCAQESKLLDNRWPTLLPKIGWCFVTNHWKRWNFTFFVWISWWVMWKSLCGTNHNKKDFAGRLLLAHLLHGGPWLL
jgi:hypothetical protein